MTDSLGTALKAIFAANLTAQFPGGFWPDQGPETTNPDIGAYLVVKVVSAPLNTLYGTARDGDYRIQFTAVGEGKSAMAAKADAAVAAFRDGAMAITGADVSNVIQPSDVIPTLNRTRSSANTEVWNQSFDLIFSIHTP